MREAFPIIRGRCSSVRQLSNYGLPHCGGAVSMEHAGRHPEASGSTVVYAFRERRKDCCGMEILVTLLLRDVRVFDLDFGHSECCVCM